MVKIVFLGSCRFAPYEILAVPDPIPGAWNTDEGYEIAFKVFKPAIDAADLVIVYVPDGIGRHTQMDLDYAKSQNKEIILVPSKGLEDGSYNDTEWDEERGKYR